MTAPARAAARPGGMFDSLERQPPDALLALIGMHAADPRADTIDVGVGVYRDEQGATPVFRAVKAAEARLLERQRSKAYLGPEGDVGFVELLERVVFGPASAASARLTGVQTPGGTGALRLGADLLALAAPGARVWMGEPTWPNHAPIFRAAGLAVQPHRYVDAAGADVDFEAMTAALARADRGDVVLLHGCCHNPTGVGLTLDQWRTLAELLAARGLVPFVDLAYQGLGDGLDADAAGMRLIVDAVPEALVAYSCDKNFGLYRERTGALWVLGASPPSAELTRATLLVLARSLWSMPPDHGAAVVRLILDDPALAADWRLELDGMRGRIAAIRSALAAGYPALLPIGRQRGLFAMLPIDATAVTRLRERDGIYMAGSGRINVAGLSSTAVTRFVAALAPFLPA